MATLRAAARTFRRAEASGDIYLVASIGCAFGAYAELSSYRKQLRERQMLAAELYDREAQHKHRLAAMEESVTASSEPIWRATIVKSRPLMLLGEMMFHGARIGQEVEVLATEQGQDEGFVQCRNAKTGATGLYPTSWVRCNESDTACRGCGCDSMTCSCDEQRMASGKRSNVRSELVRMATQAASTAQKAR